MAVNVIEMSVKNWIGVKDNPRQRDTIKRAKIASRKHLSKYHPIHRFVYAATKNGELLCKLDGHTRSCLWESGSLEMPPDGRVAVCLVEVSGLAEAKAIYDMLDTQQATKRPCDTVFGACRENGFTLNSYLLRSCAFATQLKLASSGRAFSGNIYSMVRDWKEELIELDKLALTSNYTILISVMLVSFRIDGIDKAGTFWKRLDDGLGTKTSEGYDGVQTLHEVMCVRRQQGRTAGWDNLVAICGQAWTAYEMFKNNSRRKKARLAVANFSELVTGVNV